MSVLTILYARFMGAGTIHRDRMKALPGHVYEIRDLHCIVPGAGAGSIEVFQRGIETDAFTVTSRTYDEALMATWFTSAAGVQPSFQYQDPIRTKFFTVHKLTSTGAAIVIISGTLKKAGKTELLWEWFRKGR